MPETQTQSDPAVERFLQGGPKGLWIDNDYVEAAKGETFESLDPATNEPLVDVYAATDADVDRAVASARAALDGEWGKLSPDRRGQLLYEIAAAVEGRAASLALLETLDNGKPLVNAKDGDLPAVAEVFRYYAGWTTKLSGESLPLSAGSYHCYTRREPVGVCAGIVPWNYPLVMATWKLAPALACGNVMIVKPAEQTPLSMLMFAELMRDVGLPPGVVNVLNGFGEACGKALVRHPGVDKVAFTGSHLTGQRIVEASASGLKRVSLELGGKSPNVVFNDAPDDTIEGATWGICYNTGQDCTAGSRLFIEAESYDNVLSELVAKVQGLRVGPGVNPSSELGPLISPQQLERVLGYVAVAESENAVVATGGDQLSSDGLERGNFMAPTVLTNTANDARVAQEEIFGPVVTVMPFGSEDELVRKANESIFGLGAGVWTSDVKRAHRVASALQAGTVWVNTYGPNDPAAPFGGYKMSGFGRELGHAALDLYTETKCVWIQL